MHDYDALFSSEFPFRVKGASYVLRTPTALADLEKDRIQFDGAHVDGDRVTPSYVKLLEARHAYVAASCITSEGGAVGVDQVRGWPEPVVDDLFKRASEMAGSKDDPESLRKAIASLQERLAKAEAEDPAKN